MQLEPLTPFSIAILGYLEAKFDYGYFILFFHWGPTILHKKFQVISSKIEGVTVVLRFTYKLENVILKGPKGPPVEAEGLLQGPKGPTALRRS